MMSAGYTTFNKYFVEKRIFMMSIAQSIKGACISLHPILVKFAMNAYGFRGALAIVAAVNTHAVLGMLTLQPVEWHYKIIKVPESEPRKLNIRVDFFSNTKQFFGSFAVIENTISRNEIKIVVTSDVDGDKTKKCIEKTSHKSIENTQNNVVMRNGNTENYSKPDSKRTKLWYGLIKLAIKPNNINVTLICRKKVVDYLDLTLLKDLIYVNIIIGVSSALFSDNIFTTLLPMYLRSLDFSIVREREKEKRRCSNV